MSRKSKSIPAVTAVRDPAAREALDALKQTVEAVTGRTIPVIQPLAIPTGASTIETSLIQKVNELINRLQY